ncbi:MAG: DUF1800 domain-containing protein [Bacteroidetes bacterium]|nr:DUF1800 domain-containing protein [Bacteroidota bacterium]
MSSGTLNPYSGPWTRKLAKHLVSRTNFGALKRDVDGALTDGNASEAVDRIVDAALGDPIPEPPGWYAGNGSTNQDQVYQVQRNWIDSMRTKGLIEKMTLFWHNHMPTQWTVSEGKSNLSVAHLTYDYYSLLRLHALGNFRTLIEKIGKNAAMHYYLDGYVNESGHANENFARELLELFTMGQYGPGNQLNYTETDIKEIARALTGWVVASNRTVVFQSNRHDNGSKSFLGQTGNYGYDDVIDIVFTQRSTQIATFIARKLYAFFVSAVPDETIVNGLASALVSNNFEIAPVVRMLLKSEHFYEQTFIGARIKSPIEIIVGFLREAEIDPSFTLLDSIRELLSPANLGQEPLNPPNVAGWPGLNPPDASGDPGHHQWLTTSTLPERWNTLTDIIYQRTGASYDPVELAIKVSDPSDPFRIAIDLAETFIPISLSETGIRTVDEPFGGDPNFPIPDEIANGPEYYRNLSKILLDGAPFYEWPLVTDVNSPGTEDIRKLLRAYLSYLIQLPAYQLT